MTVTDLCQEIFAKFYQLEGARELLSEPVSVTVSEEPERTLRPEGDPPSTVARPEYCVTAELCGTKGEAYTETPKAFQGTLEEAFASAPSEKGINATAVAALNAAMNKLGLCPGVFPEEEQAHYAYADALCRHITENFGRSRIVLVGYDGYLVKRFMDEGLDFWTMDRNPDHVAQDRFDHVVVNSAKRNRESSFAWGKLFLITGSTLCNGTIVQYLDSGKDLLFYGITGAGAATLLSLPWFSPETV